MAIEGTDIKRRRKQTGKPTVQELIDAYATAGGSSFTVEMASAFSDFLGHAAEDITLLEIEAWRENLEKATSNKFATINKHVSALKAILNFAVDRELIDHNPIVKIKKLKMDAPDGEYAGQIKVPAMFRFENTITVGASGEEYERSEEAGSNYSSSGKWMDVFASGGHILSTCRYEPITGEDNTWSGDGSSISGTSIATPYVTGVSALLCSVFPERGAAEIKQMILDDAGGSILREGYSKYGRLDAYGAWKAGMRVVSEVEPAGPGQIPVSDGAVAVRAEFAADRDALPESLKNCVTAADGSLYLDYAIARNAVESMDGARNVESISLFPVFTARGGEDVVLGSGVVAAFAFTVPGEIFGEGCGLGGVAICKVKPDGTCLGYSRDEDGGARYNVVLYIADDGPYDLDGAVGAIANPTAIVRYGAEKQAVSGGGGGGCSAGFGAAAFIASSAYAAFAQDEARGSRYARGEAVVLLRVPEEIRRSGDRRGLFAAYCREVAANAATEVVYVSPVYETSECATATFRSKLDTEELVRRLKRDARVAGASPNYIIKLSRLASVRN